MDVITHKFDNQQFNAIIKSIKEGDSNGKGPSSIWTFERAALAVESALLLLSALATVWYFAFYEREKTNLEIATKRIEIERLGEFRLAFDGDVQIVGEKEGIFKLIFKASVKNESVKSIDIRPARVDIFLGRVDKAWDSTHSVFFVNPPYLPNELRPPPGGILWELIGTFAHEGGAKDWVKDLYGSESQKQRAPVGPVFLEDGACTKEDLRSGEITTYTQEYLISIAEGNEWVGLTFYALVVAHGGPDDAIPKTLTFRKGIKVPTFSTIAASKVPNGSPKPNEQ